MRRITTLAVVLALALAAAASQAQNYLIFDITPSHYGYMAPYAINSAGHITGTIEAGNSGAPYAFTLVNGALKVLGGFGYGGSNGAAINDSDQLLINAETPGVTTLLYSNGTATPIGNVDGGYSAGFGMNNLGDAVGTALNGDGNWVGFSWIGGVFTDLSTLGYIYRARAINDSDQFVGSVDYWIGGAENRHAVPHGFLDSGGTVTDIGSLSGNSGTNTEAFGIDAAGDVVGYSTASDGLEHAFLYSGGVMQDLGTIGTDYAAAIAINNNGLIIGNLTNPYNAPIGSFVYQNGSMTPFQNILIGGGAGWTSLWVTAVNDSGWIVGYGTIKGYTHGFVAIPAASQLATTLTVSSAKGQVGKAAALTATLRVTSIGGAVGGEPVQFSVDGAPVGSPVTTGANGQAILSWVVPEGTSLGSHTITATHAADANFGASSGKGMLTVAKGPVKISVPKVTGAAGTTVTLTAKLTDASGAALSGETLSFSVAGAAAGSATTGANGVATVNYSIPSGTAAGNYQILVTFGGDASHLSGSRTGTLVVK